PLRMVLRGPRNKRPRNVVPIARALLHGMRGCQSFAAVVEDQAGEQAGILCVCSRSPVDPVFGEERLDLVPKGLVHDGLVLSRIGVFGCRWRNAAVSNGDASVLAS